MYNRNDMINDSHTKLLPSLKRMNLLVTGEIEVPESSSKPCGLIYGNKESEICKVREIMSLSRSNLGLG